MKLPLVVGSVGGGGDLSPGLSRFSFVFLVVSYTGDEERSHDLLVVVSPAVVVGALDLVFITSPFDQSSTKPCFGDEDRCRWSAARPSPSSPGVTCSFLSRSNPQIRHPSPALWSPADYPYFCSFLAATTPVGSSKRSGDVMSDDSFVARWKFKWRVCVGVLWYGRKKGVMPKMIDGVMGIFPELVPVVYCISTGVGSSFCVLSFIWATGVGSGWFNALLFVSTGLLCGFAQGCHVIIIVECLRRSVEFGSFLIPKGVVEPGLYLMSRGVTCVGPFGIIFLLTVLVSGLSSGGFIPCSTLRLDVLIVMLYVTFISVLVSLTLNTYHMFYCGVV